MDDNALTPLSRQGKRGKLYGEQTQTDGMQEPPMITQRLWNLQEIDTRIDALAQELLRLEQALQEPELLTNLRKHIRQLEEEQARLAREQRELELEMQSLTEQRTGLERRLYGGYITNPREVEAAQHKAEELRHREQGVEDHILDIMMTLETLQADLGSLKTQLTEATKEWSQTERDLLKRRTTLQEEHTELKAQREHLVTTIPAGILAVYERLRRTKRGIAVARLEQRMCQACGIEVPINVERQAHYSEDLVFCPTCGRILYR